MEGRAQTPEQKRALIERLLVAWMSVPGISLVELFSCVFPDYELSFLDQQALFSDEALVQLVEEWANEREWDAIVSQPHVKATLRRRAKETRRTIAAGETIEGGFDGL